FPAPRIMVIRRSGSGEIHTAHRRVGDPPPGSLSNERRRIESKERNHSDFWISLADNFRDLLFFFHTSLVAPAGRNTAGRQVHWARRRQREGNLASRVGACDSACSRARTI